MKFLKKSTKIKVLTHLLILLFLKFSYLLFCKDIINLDEVGNFVEDIRIRYGSWRVFVYHINQVIAPLYGCLIIFFSSLTKKDLEHLPDQVFLKYKKLVNELKLLPAAQIGYYIYEIYILLQFDLEMRTANEMFINPFFISITLTMLVLYIIKNVVYDGKFYN